MFLIQTARVENPFYIMNNESVIVNTTGFGVMVESKPADPTATDAVRAGPVVQGTTP